MLSAPAATDGWCKFKQIRNAIYRRKWKGGLDRTGAKLHRCVAGNGGGALAREKLNPSNVFAALFTGAAALLVVAINRLPDIATDPSLLKIVLFVAPLLFFGAAVHYYFVLGGGDEPAGSYSRGKYDALRDDLEDGGGFNLTYARGLGRVLDWLDGVMGDRGAAPESRLARSMGVETRRPTWTAAAYDRCLLLAMLYPLVSIFALWVWSGHVGIAEHAIGLPDGKEVEAWKHWAAPAGLAIYVFVFLRQHWAERLSSILIWLLAIGVAVAGDFALAFAIAITIMGSTYRSGARIVAVSVLVPVTVTIISTTFGVAPGALVFAVTCAVIASVAYAFDIVRYLSHRSGRRGLFLGVLCAVLAFACYFAAWRYGGALWWDKYGVLLLFLGLLTLVNAPFDWFAIGLTRWLLRKGLAKQGPWPVVYGALDAVAAAISVAALAFVCVVAVQLFGDLAVHHAKTVLHAENDNARIIHFAQLFDSLENHPTDYENWWIWLMLFSTAIPSVVNLLIACFSLLRGWPPLGRWMGRQFREGEAMAEPVKIGLAAILSAQIAHGVLMSGALLYGLMTRAGPLVLPAYAGWLRDASEWLAACNVPAHVVQWAAGLGWGASCW